MPVATARSEEFAALGDTARRLLALGEEWKSWVLVDRDPVDVWTDGRVALLGDAAHPMLHYAAQGACRGWRTRWSSANCWTARADEMAARFDEYNAARRASTARIQRLARDSIPPVAPGGRAADGREPRWPRCRRPNSTTVAWMHGAREFDSPAVPA